MKARIRQKSFLLGLFPVLTFGMIAGAAVQAEPAAAAQAPQEHATESSAPDTDDTTTDTPLQTCEGNVLCGGTASATCCEARCKCNGFKAGSCRKMNSPLTACWCTNDSAKFSTAPSTCKNP